MAEQYAVLAGDLSAYDDEDLDRLPPLDEQLLRSTLAELGADVDADGDEGFWGLDTLVYDIVLFRGSDGAVRMLTGEMHYDSRVSATDARTVFTGLHGLAARLGGRFWLVTGTGGAPLSLSDLEEHIREAARALP